LLFIPFVFKKWNFLEKKAKLLAFQKVPLFGKKKQSFLRSKKWNFLEEVPFFGNEQKK
jgi:hypothetical protein